MAAVSHDMKRDAFGLSEPGYVASSALLDDKLTTASSLWHNLRTDRILLRVSLPDNS